MMNRRLTASLLTVCALALPVAASGCNAHPIKPVGIAGNTEIQDPLPLDVNKKVDVLLVIDNSGSMGEEQANLAANFGPFIDELDKAGADYRIGITTTDIGGPGCAASAGGELQLSSCLDRPETFVFNGQSQFDVACEAQCGLTGDALEVRPTSVESGGEEAARPWIQSYNGVGNLPEEVDTLDAFQCFAPQGISGCGWESPLEATARALGNMQDPSAPEYGFLRDDALLAVLIVTDEVDCSFNAGAEAALFEAETFWAEGAGFATSAVCWNAGVACSGDSPYDDCFDVDRDAAGQETTDASAMMLRPVSSYVAALEDVAAQKLEGREVLVSVIAGVPAGYSSGAVEQLFADSDDPEFQRKFGIGAGCEGEVDGVIQTAVPPVRLETFASAFVGSALPEGARNLYSVCESDYTPAVLDIVRGIEGELPPACFQGCVLDVDADTPELDFSCDVIESSASEQRSLPECASGTEGWELPAGEDVCWIAKTGDELADACVAEGRNLEFELLRRPGVSVPSDVQVAAVCELSSFPSIDCAL